jgi:hypothetical protein
MPKAPASAPPVGGNSGIKPRITALFFCACGGIRSVHLYQYPLDLVFRCSTKGEAK